MKILFDLSATQPENNIINHGGSEYTKAVFTRLVELCKGEITVFYNKKLYLDESLEFLIKNRSLNSLQTTEVKDICSFITENNINLFYTALPKEDYLPLLKMQSEKFKVVITIHGLRQLEAPADKYEWIYCRSFKSRIKYLYKLIFSTLYKRSVLHHYMQFLDSSAIITVSNHSKRSLLAFFPQLDPDRINVFYSPLINYSAQIIPSDDILKDFSLDRHKYFLILSGSIWIKNSYRAVKAFDSLISDYAEFSSFKMVVTGTKDSMFRVSNQDNFVFTGYLNRDVLEEILKNSYALMYPTLNEGFGYPPLEAMKYGVPVLASDIAAVKEVCGDQVTYFNPLDIKNIRLSMLRAIETDSLHSAENSTRRINHYSQIRKKQKQDLDKLVDLLCCRS